MNKKILLLFIMNIITTIGLIIIGITQFFLIMRLG